MIKGHSKIDRTVDEQYDTFTSADKTLLETALKRGATRREAMSMMTAAGMSIAVAGSVVTFAENAIAATPKKGGKIKMASSIQGPNDTLLAPLLTGMQDYSRARCLYNGLVQLSDDIVPQPELAEEFSANADATEWTFKLRKDVKWHDGSKFTADDVIYTMNMHYGEDSVSVVKSLVSDVNEWKKTGPYEVKAVLNGPNAELATILGEKQFKMMKVDTADMLTPPGTGPFTLEDFQPGVRSLHKRNENYWREGANVDEVEIFGITDSTARVNALLSGDIDLMMDLDPKAISQVESSGNARVKSQPSGAFMGMALMADRTPGNNPDFVKGMKFLQRRDKIVKSILKGQGTLGNDQPINVAYGVDFCTDLPVRPFDPDQAKHYLDKSGITSAEVHVAEVRPGITDACLMWQRECSKIGFDLQIKKVPNDGYWGAVWQHTPINTSTWNMRPTATVMLNAALAPDAPWNDTFWKNDRMGRLLKMIKSETNMIKRHEIMCEMQTLAHNESGMIIPAHLNVVDAHSSKVHGIPNLALGPLGAAEWPEFVWLED